MKRNIDWNDKDAVRAYHREYNKKRYVPKKRKENKIDWNDKDARRAYDREYYALKKKEYQKEYQKEYRKTHKGYHKKYYVPREKVRKGECPNNPNEIWKDIDGYDGWYMISNQGRIWSWRTGRLLTTPVNKNGYRCAHFYYGGKMSHKLLHRLIAIAFLDNPNGYNEIDHIDTNPLNNDLSNLRWVESHKENMNNPLTLEHFKESNKGKGNFGPDVWERNRVKQRKPVLQYTLDWEFIKEYDSAKTAGIETGIDRNQIGDCCRGYRGTKTAGGYIWRFKNAG